MGFGPTPTNASRASAMRPAEEGRLAAEAVRSPKGCLDLRQESLPFGAAQSQVAFICLSPLEKTKTKKNMSTGDRFPFKPGETKKIALSKWKISRVLLKRWTYFQFVGIKAEDQ